MLSQHPSPFPQHSSPTCRHQLRCMKAVPVSAQHHPGGGSVTLLSCVPWALCSAGFRWAPSPEPPYFCSLPGLMAQEDAQVMAPTRVPWSEAVRKALSQKPNPKSDNAPKVAKKSTDLLPIPRGQDTISPSGGTFNFKTLYVHKAFPLSTMSGATAAVTSQRHCS